MYVYIYILVYTYISIYVHPQIVTYTSHCETFDCSWTSTRSPSIVVV